jgi:RNA polymerase sigma-70 factor (ECF subfamily)
VSPADGSADCLGPGSDNRGHISATAEPRGQSGVDAESAGWLQALRSTGQARELALARLHTLLLRAARSELHRREGRHPVTGPELDDLAHQAADDALMAIIAKLGQFRGESRFTTWAYKFAVLEVSAKLGRHFWQRPAVTFEAVQWDRLPDRIGMQPDDLAEQADLLAALRRAVEEQLTDRQRRVFMAIVVDGTPLDALVVQLGSNRNALYKTMFDARRKLRAVLAANGYLAGPADGPADLDWVRRSS